jgi:hypothetical protein
MVMNLQFGGRLPVDPKLVSKVTIFAHMPQLALGEGAPFDLGFGRLSGLDFEQWVLLEDPAAGWLQRHYESARPSFFIFSLTTEQLPALETAGERDLRPALALINAVHWALVMTLGPLLEPGYSMAYALLEPHDMTLRLAGPLERDQLMTPAWQPRLLNPGDTLLVRRRAERVRFLSERGEEDAVLRGFDGVRLLGAPRVSLLEALLTTVQTLEDILNPDGEMGKLSEDFADRLALVVSPTFAAYAQWRDACKQLYKVRSVIAHGGAAQDELAKLAAMTPGLSPAQLIYYLGLCVSSALGALVERHSTSQAAEHALNDLFETPEPLTEQRFADAQEVRMVLHLRESNDGPVRRYHTERSGRIGRNDRRSVRSDRRPGDRSTRNPTRRHADRASASWRLADDGAESLRGLLSRCLPGRPQDLPSCAVFRRRAESRR